MTKLYKFKHTKQSLKLDSKAYNILKSYQKAVHIIYKNQNDNIIDLENSIVSDLKNNESIDQDLISQKIS